MLLSRNVVVSEWRCVETALCLNGDMSDCILSGYVFDGDDPVIVQFGGKLEMSVVAINYIKINNTLPT